MEKIDIHNSENEYHDAVKKLKSDKNIHKKNIELFLEYLRLSAIGKTARRNSRIKTVSVRGRLKNLYLLKGIGYYFKKPLKNLTIKDVETYISDLNSNKIKKHDGSKYSEQTKSNYKKMLVLFLSWLFGENSKKFNDLTSWIDTRFKKKSIEYFRENEVIEILKKCNTPKQKILITALFDGGFRIEEFLNIRMGDITLVEGDVPYYRIKVRTEYSKTEGREVPMFWKYSTDIIRDWLEINFDLSNDDQFFKSSYDGVRMLLNKIGSRTGKKITAHKLRRSAAFHYANQGHGEYRINKRFGWASGSDVGGKYYVQQSDIDLEENKQKVEYENLKLEEVKENLKRTEEQNKFLNEKVSELQEKFASFDDMKIALMFLVSEKFNKQNKGIEKISLKELDPDRFDVKITEEDNKINLKFLGV